MLTRLALPVATACAIGVVTVAPSTSAEAAANIQPTALSALAGLRLAPSGSLAGYSRAQYGQAWSDDVAVDGGHNGCDTRNDVLRRDLRSLVVKAGTHGCVALSGRLIDPYTGATIAFQRSRASVVDIDHVVPLADAWRSGASRLSAAKRRDLANDPLNLRAVSASVNRSKGDKSAASWLPTTSFRCTYVAEQIAVKRRYGLSVTAAERTAMTRVLRACPAQRIPAALDVPRLAASPAPRPVTPTPRPVTPAPPKPSVPPVAVYYANCTAVRAAGKAPLYRGQPGYRAALDRDDDGVACE